MAAWATPSIWTLIYGAHGVAPPLSADLDTLRRLHRAHVQAIPFENLDIQMGLPVEIDAEAIQRALVARQRGGYCFQQNGLFRLALIAVGFAPRARAARVRLDANGSHPAANPYGARCAD